MLETLVPVILAQKVTGKEAADSYRRLMFSSGEAVGFGPWPDLLVPPEPRVWANVPSLAVAPRGRAGALACCG